MRTSCYEFRCTGLPSRASNRLSAGEDIAAVPARIALACAVVKDGPRRGSPGSADHPCDFREDDDRLRLHCRPFGPPTLTFLKNEKNPARGDNTQAGSACHQGQAARMRLGLGERTARPVA